MKRVFNLFSKSKTDRSKYGNKQVVHDGITFDSIKEGERYLFLKEQQKKGVISNLQCHVKYELIPHQAHIVHRTKQLKTKLKEWDEERTLFLAINFTPDFVYERDGRTVAEDVKGSKFLTSKDFPLRQKLLYFRHGIYVHIITKATEPIPNPPIATVATVPSASAEV